MKDCFAHFLKFIDANAYVILLAVFALWTMVGIFPLVCYEGDGMEVLFGCDLMSVNGWSLPPDYCYEYRMHPLLVVSIVSLHQLLPMLTCEQAYCLIAAVSSFVFLVGCVEFVRHIVGARRVVVLLAAMLLPEMYAIAMYPNSAIPAAAIFIWALVLLYKDRYVVAGILMCVAPLFRVDIVAVYPVVYPLFLLKGKAQVKSIALSAAYAVLVVVVGLTGFWLLKAPVLQSLGGYAYWSNTISSQQVLLAIFGFYSLSYLLLLPVGICAIVKKRLWKELFLVVLPIVLQHYIYRSMGCASKHYLYIAPFVIIAGVRAFSLLGDLVRGRRWLQWVCACLVIAFYTLSVRIIPESKPWFEKDVLYNGGSVATFGSTKFSFGTVAMGMGAGQYIPTLDEKMLGSGQLFYPLYIHDNKCAIARERSQLKEALATVKDPTLKMLEWGTRGWLASMYLPDGYQLSSHGKSVKLSGKSQVIRLLSDALVEDEKDVARLMKELKDSYASVVDAIYFVADSPRNKYNMERFCKRGMLEKVTPNLYKYNLSEDEIGHSTPAPSTVG